MTKLIANEQFKICFIEDEEERRKRADFWLENIQESFYRLSKECGYESVAVTVPLRDSFAPIYNCGPKSIIALRKLMDTTIHKEVLLHSQGEWNFDLLPSEDIFKVYIDCFHSLAREREHLNFCFLLIPLLVRSRAFFVRLLIFFLTLEAWQAVHPSSRIPVTRSMSKMIARNAWYESATVPYNNVFNCGWKSFRTSTRTFRGRPLRRFNALYVSNILISKNNPPSFVGNTPAAIRKNTKG